MRLVTLRMGDGSTTAASIVGSAAVRLPFSDVGELLAQPEWRSIAADGGPPVDADPDDVAPVIPRPGKIACVGHNYAAHVAEQRVEEPRFPTWFAKFSAALCGANDPLVLPLSQSRSIDWEVELAVVIGRHCHRIPRGQSEEVVAGYCVANDVSVRDFQFRTSQFLQGKTFVGLTPLGPALVTPDELPGGSPADLRIVCRIDEEVVQDARTSDMIFDVDRLVHELSWILPLEPGDVLLTGTPSGVGAWRRPPRFLQPGQQLVSTIEGLGSLRNTCVAEPALAEPSLSGPPLSGTDLSRPD